MENHKILGTNIIVEGDDVYNKDFTKDEDHSVHEKQKKWTDKDMENAYTVGQSHFFESYQFNNWFVQYKKDHCII